MDNNILWAQYKDAPDSVLKKQIMLNYSNLVHYVIHNSRFISNEIFDDRDYYQFGIEGLSEAIDRFDPDYGTKFETYAIQRIRGKIIDELRRAQSKIKYYVKNNDGQYSYNQSVLSLNASIDADGNSQLYEVTPADVPTPSETTEKSEAKEMLVEAIKKLKERDRLIITLYYYEELNYKEIAETLGITVSRVSQVHKKIITSLKKKLSSLHE